MSALTEQLRPEDGELLSEEEFARTAGLARAQVRELQEYGLLAPRQLDVAAALALREAARLGSDFDLDLFSTGLLAGYIEEIRALRAEMARLRAEQPARTVVTEVSFTSVEIRGAP